MCAVSHNERRHDEMDNPEALTRLERSTLIRWFMYYLDQEGRRKLMTELPYHYAKLTNTSPHEWSINLTDAIHNAVRRGEA
jgi:predicted 2-oxoglutarate/Fe(II)-dependent dioxygenase YbiX